jgi:phosphate transport system permease protein
MIEQHDETLEYEFSKERPDPSAPLTATGNLGRRMVINRVVETASIGAAIFAIGVLGLLIFTVVQRGGSAISWDFLTKPLPEFGGAGGGIAPAIIGSAEVVAIATLIATLPGVLLAIYLSEFAGGRAASVLRLVLDLMNGLPSIVIGLFIYGLVVADSGQKGIAASMALAIIMLPLISRSSQEVLRLVPQGLRDASDALGVSRWRSIVTVILPTSLGGILTGVVLAVARAAGETAPMLILNASAVTNTQLNPLQSMPNIPYLLFSDSEQGGAQTGQAWGAALVLLTVILIANVGSRYVLARNKAKAGQ